MNIYIIAGYGVPVTNEDEARYQLYLTNILDLIVVTSAEFSEEVIIIFSGGNTDTEPPYNRTEAEEMKNRFVALADNQGADLERMHFLLEDQSLSTLENVLNTHDLIRKHDFLDQKIIYICEPTRAERVKIFVKKIYTDARDITVRAVDYYFPEDHKSTVYEQSDNEVLATKIALWALQDSERMNLFRKFFEQKFHFLRTYKGAKEDALREWRLNESKKTLQKLGLPLE